MLANTETFVLTGVGFIVTFFVAGIIPYQIAKLTKTNTSQHQDGLALRNEHHESDNAQRAKQMAVLEKLSRKQDEAREDILVIRDGMLVINGELFNIKQLRALDQEEFRRLFERVVENEYAFKAVADAKTIVEEIKASVVEEIKGEISEQS